MKVKIEEKKLVNVVKAEVRLNYGKLSLGKETEEVISEITSQVPVGTGEDVKMTFLQLVELTVSGSTLISVNQVYPACSYGRTEYREVFVSM